MSNNLGRHEKSSCERSTLHFMTASRISSQYGYMEYGLEDCFFSSTLGILSSELIQANSSLVVVHSRRQPHPGINSGTQFVIHTLSHLSHS
jgi:hypothetical protein